MTERMSKVVCYNYLRGPKSQERVAEALNALALTVATVLAGTGNDPDARRFFDGTLDQQLGQLLRNPSLAPNHPIQ
jgi:hypothetical protein